MEPFLIGIAGGTGSGKTLFSQMIAKKFKREVLVISHDMYYKDQSTVPLRERQKMNMDCPDALDNELLTDHLKKLKAGIAIEAPIYNFQSHSREKATRMLKPKRVIIVEGLLTLAVRSLWKMLDLKIYIEVDGDLRLARRILRDVKEGRAKNLEKSIDQYLSSAYPMHKRYVEAQKENADLIVPWNNMGWEAVETVVARIEGELQERGFNGDPNREN